MSDPNARLSTALAGRYRIESELGQGGMATVYLAHDVKHDRKVALKVLRPELAAVVGGDRFLTEIRTTANLQHPHILPLFDSGAADGFLFYVMPFIDGESVRDRLGREKQLAVDDALQITCDVAAALDYAHRHRVIHRDIKPGNILLHDGSALVTDFGIALAASHAGGTRMTETGMSLGTPSYMSPEQAMGEREITARSDVYGLGCVLYEMLTGEPPFAGPTTQAIMARVMTAAPVPPSELRPRVPPHVEQAVLKALEKLPADRFASAAQFADALTRPEWAPMTGDAPHTGDLPPWRPSWRSVIVGVAALLLAVEGAWWLGRRSANAEAPWSSFTQLTDVQGVETSPSLSPDGESFAYASDRRGSWDIFVQRVGGRNPMLVAGDSARDEVWPAYSPDGTQIAYNVRGGGIFRIGATGENPRRLAASGANPAWSPDGGHIVFGSEEVVSPYTTTNTGTLWTVATSGGPPRQLTSLADGDAYEPAWSPSGSRIAFWTSTNGQRDIVTIPADGGARVKVTDDVAVDWAPSWSPDGKYLYFASDRGGAMGIWRIRIDEASGRPHGAPRPVASGVDVAMDLPHLSKDGQALLFRAEIESVNPASITFDPATGRAGAVTVLQNRTGILTPADVSPDGKWLALFNAPDRRQDVFIMRPDGSSLTRLTDDAARDWYPRFTPDGESLMFFSNQSGTYQGWSIRLDGSRRTRITDVSDGVYFLILAPNGKRLVVQPLKSEAMIGAPPWPLTEARSTPLTGLQIAGGMFEPSQWSPDGRWLSGRVLLPSGEARWVAVYEIATHRARLLSDDFRGYGYDLTWLPGSQHVVYFTRSGALVMQNITSLARREIVASLPYPPDQIGSIVASPDGRTLYYGARQTEANIWMVKQLAPTQR